jgi:uncharacterized repeat protein (TIGR01451 family)
MRRICSWLFDLFVLAVAVSCAAIVYAPRAAAQADLQIAIEVHPKDVLATGRAVFALTVGNAGDAAAANVTVEALLPASGMVGFNQSFVSSGGTCTGSGNLNGSCDAGETVTWSLGTVPPGAGRSLSFPLVAANGTAAGTALVVTARVRSNGALADEQSTETVVRSALPLTLAVEADRDPVAPGASLTYTLVFSNRGNATIQNVTLGLLVPAVYGFGSATDGGSFAAGSVTWNVGTLLPGQSDSRRAILSVGAGLAPGRVVGPLTATVAGTAPGAVAAGAEAVSRIATAGPLDVAVELAPDPPVPGEMMHVSISAANGGASDLLDVVVEARVPSEWSAFGQQQTTDTGQCSSSGNLNASCDAGERVRWSLGTLPAGASRTLSLPPFVAPATADGSLVAVPVEVQEGGGGQARARQTVAARTTRKLQLALDEEQDPAAPGGSVAWTIRYGNAGAVSAQGLSLRVPLPPGVTFLDATGGGTESGGTVTWSLGTLLPGESGAERLRVALPVGDAGTLLRVHDARLVESTPTPETARAAAVTRIATPDPLRIALEANPDPALPGETLQVGVVVANRSAGTLADVVVELLLPDAVGAFNQNFSTLGGSCTATGNLNASCDPSERVRWSLGTLEPGTGRTLTVPPTTVAGIVGGDLIRLQARVSRPGSDPQLATITLGVDPDRTLDLALDADLDPAAPGTELAYTLTYGNPGDASLQDVALTLPLPPGVDHLASDDDAVLVGGDEPRVEWQLGTLVPGEVGERRARALVTATDGEILRGAAASIAHPASPIATFATRAAQVAARAPLALALELGPAPVEPGEALRVQLTVANRGAAPLFDVIVEARMPQLVQGFTQNLATGNGSCTESGNLNTSCDGRERLRWSVGSLPAGGGITLDVPPRVAAGAAHGAILTLQAQALHALGEQQLVAASVPIQEERRLELAIDDRTDPLALGGQLRYALLVGNRGPGAATGVTLRLPLPPGVVVAEPDGVANEAGDAAEWQLGTIAPGTSVHRYVGLLPDPTLVAGDLVRIDGGRAQEAAADGSVAFAESVTRLGSSPIELELLPGARSAKASSPLPVRLRARNRGAQSLFGLVLEARVPEEVLSFSQTTTTGGGDCTISGNLNTSCDARERVRWSIGTLAPGTTLVEMRPTLAGVVDGTLVPFSAVAFDDGGNRAIDGVTVPVPAPGGGVSAAAAAVALGALARRSARKRRR